MLHNTTMGKDSPVKDIYEKHDAIFLGIGAQTGKTLRIEGADAGNVVSAVIFGSDWKWKSS